MHQPTAAYQSHDIKKKKKVEKYNAAAVYRHGFYKRLTYPMACGCTVGVAGTVLMHAMRRMSVNTTYGKHGQAWMSYGQRLLPPMA